MISDADSNAASSPVNHPSMPGADRPRPSGSEKAPVTAAPQGDALFLDVDGTLLRIAPHPDAVQVSPDLLALLERLAARADGALALISGRSIDNLDALFAPLVLPCAGVHGLERRGADAVIHRCDTASHLAPLRAPLDAFVRSHDGLLLEDKGQSLALHFRKAPACEALAEKLLRGLIAASSPVLELKRGKMVLEVMPAIADKGTAIVSFMEEPPFAGRRPVFIGDDVTDEDGFAAVNALGGLSIRVGPETESAARHRLANEEAVEAWLRAWLDHPQDRKTR
ncbi:MAG: trehalose-phosphatase [Kiloniellaceae bacterium]